MIDRPITHLVINDIRVEEKEILVGATDNERWRWDMADDVETGANAKTIVYVALVKVRKTNDGKDFFNEEAGFHCQPGDPTRVVGMTYLIELFEVAWSIVNESLDFQTAQKRYFGKQVKKNY